MSMNELARRHAVEIAGELLDTVEIPAGRNSRVLALVVELVRRARDGGRDEPDNAPLPPGVEGFAPGRPG